MSSRQSVWLSIETPDVICAWTNEMPFHKHWIYGLWYALKYLFMIACKLGFVIDQDGW